MNCLFIKFTAIALILAGCATGEDLTRISILSEDTAPLSEALDATVIRFVGNGSSGPFSMAEKSLDKNVGLPKATAPDEPTRIERKNAVALQVRREKIWPLAGKVDFVVGLSGGVGHSQFVLPDGARLDSGVLLPEPITVQFQSATVEIGAALQRGFELSNTFDVVVTGGVSVQGSHIYTKIRSPLLKVDGDDLLTGSITFLRAELSAGSRLPSLRGEIRKSSSGHFELIYGLDFKL